MRKSCDNLVIETRRVGNSVILVARKGGRRVGGASFWLADAECARRDYEDMREKNVLAEDGRIALLRTLTVTWMARRTGIGARLVGLASRLARKAGASTLYVHAVDIEGGNPLSFYLSCGFAVVHRNSDSNHYMKKLLVRASRARD